jgi:hypothetical protein
MRYVMINGQLFDAAMMDGIGNQPRRRAMLPWQR